MTCFKLTNAVWKTPDVQTCMLSLYKVYFLKNGIKQWYDISFVYKLEDFQCK